MTDNKQSLSFLGNKLSTDGVCRRIATLVEDNPNIDPKTVDIPEMGLLARYRIIEAKTRSSENIMRICVWLDIHEWRCGLSKSNNMESNKYCYVDCDKWVDSLTELDHLIELMFLEAAESGTKADETKTDQTSTQTKTDQTLMGTKTDQTPTETGTDQTLTKADQPFINHWDQKDIPGIYTSVVDLLKSISLIDADSLEASLNYPNTTGWNILAAIKDTQSPTYSNMPMGLCVRVCPDVGTCGVLKYLVEQGGDKGFEYTWVDSPQKLKALVETICGERQRKYAKRD